MPTEYKTYYPSKIGTFLIRGTEEGITALEFVKESANEPGPVKRSNVPACLQACLKQLDEYFAGRRKEFSLRLTPEGTGFQQRVWQELLNIPFGETVSYGDVARAIGSPKAVRAVGGANGRNKIAVIIPCHRVIGSSGTLTGYGGGLWRKEWLLDHERNILAGGGEST